MKRVYREASAIDLEGGHGVALDGRPVQTPAKRPLVVPGRALAEAVAGEWQAQGEDIKRETMPLTRLVCTAIDRVALGRDAVIAETANYAETDLLCYRAEKPDDLIKRQHQAWQPLLDWVRTRYEADLKITAGLMPKAQDAESLARLRGAVADLDDMMLTALHFATTACGSLVIALALLEGEIDADAAWAASQVDETWQIEKWGADDELERQREALRCAIADAARLMVLLRA